MKKLANKVIENSDGQIYFAVDSADVTAKKVRAVGGRVLAEPFDVMETGRMTVVQ